MNESDPFVFRVTDLKQYVYCPRILYYHTVLPMVRPVTYKMEAGIGVHQMLEAREKRRSLQRYGLKEGKRHFNVALFDPQLGLSGEVDMLVETDDELIPVDFKNTKKAHAHFKLQLMAYGRLLETVWSGAPKRVERGLLYLVPSRKVVTVKFTTRLRNKLKTAVAELTAIARYQQMPAAPTSYGRCLDCEFRRFCNDVL